MRILETEGLSVREVMEKDRLLLKELKEPTLHFYSWREPSATYGYFIDPERLFRKGHRLDIGRRPTGGGVIFHLSDFTFSLLLPKGHPLYRSETLDSYAALHASVREALLPIAPLELAEGKETDPLLKQFCMAHPVRYDLEFQGKKIGGAAERRTREGLLHQASLFVAPPNLELVESSIIEGVEVASEIARTSSSLTEDRGRYLELKAFIKERLIVVFKPVLE